MPHYPSQDDISILRQKSKEQYYVKLELLNKQKQMIDELQGEINDGSICIDADSDIRRIGNMTFFVKDRSYFVSQTSKIWFDKYVRVKIGSKYIRTGKILWYNIGIFLFNENNFNYDNKTRLLSISCVDLTATFTGERNGVLSGQKTTIPNGSNIREAMISTISQLGGISKYIIYEDENPDYRIVPYDLEFGTGLTVYDLVKKIRELYPAWETFFDDDTFVFQKIPTAENDIKVLDDSILNELIISEAFSISLSEPKNCIQVWGLDGLNATVKLVSKEPSKKEENTYYIVNPDSPFTIDKIGEIFDVKSGGEYEKIYTVDLCRQRAEYEIWLATNLSQRIVVPCILIPWLDVNTKISYRSKMTNETYQYIIKKINFGFTSGIMTFEAIRFYPLYPHIVS